jgi:hypothetical protein
MESAKAHLWQCIQPPQPGFFRIAQICCQAHRRGNLKILMRAVESLATASDEDMRVLLRVVEPGERSYSGRPGDREAVPARRRGLELMRERLKEAREAVARFRSYGRGEF